MVSPTTSTSSVLKLAIGLVMIGTVGAAAVATHLDPITIVFWRSAIGAMFLLVWCLATGILPDRTVTLKSLALGAVAGISLVMSWAAFFGGIKLTSISTATILFHTQPFIILLIGAVIWKERVTRDQMIWLGAAFVGVVLSSGLSLSSDQIDHDWLMGILITIIGALLYAITAIAGKGLADQRGEITTLCQTLAGVAIFAPFVDFHQDVELTSWGWLSVIGVFHTGVAWVVIYSAYPFVSTPVMAVMSFLNPLTAILTDWIFFDHLLGPAQGVGMVLIVIGTLGVKLGWRLTPRSVPSS